MSLTRVGVGGRQAAPPAPRMSWNVLAGLANSAGVALIGLLAVPFYLRDLGVEAYGLIGLFTAVQALFSLLDMGLAPTLNREVARSLGQADRGEVRNLVHSVTLLYWALAAGIVVVTALAAPMIGASWLRASSLAPQTIRRVVVLMAAVIACRLPIAQYAGALMGAQRVALASLIEMGGFALANIGAVLVLAFVARSLEAFFVWQALAATVSVATVRAAAWRALRDEGPGRAPAFDIRAIGRVWRFSAHVGLAAIFGSIAMQGDKVVLGRLVSLSALGAYSLAGVAARSLYVLVTPVFGAVYPRMAALQGEQDHAQIEHLYRTGTRALVAAVTPVAMFLGLFSRDIFSLWLHDPALARSVGPVVDFLLVGVLLHGAMHFPYALLLASGRSNWLLAINALLVVAYLPLVALLTAVYGVTGAAAAWTGATLLYLAAGAVVTENGLGRGLGSRWLCLDVLRPIAITAVVAGVGGWWVRQLDLTAPVRLALGAAFAALAFAVVILLSPDLAAIARRLAARAWLRARR